MNLAILVQDIHRLNHELERFERKYGVMSEIFYESYSAGEEPKDDTWVLDFEKWAGLYEAWRTKQQTYSQAVRHLYAQRPLLKNLQPVAA